MSEDATRTVVRARGELHRVIVDLKHYLRLQQASGAPGAMPAPAHAREAFAAVRKAREQAKLELLKRGLRAAPPAASAPPGASASAPTSAPAPTSPARRLAPDAGAPKQGAPDVGTSAGPSLWKTAGSRPAARFDAAPPAAPPPPTPTRPTAPQQPAQPAQPTSRAPAAQDDIALESYAMQFSSMEDEMPHDYHPGAQLYDTRPAANPRAKVDPAQMTRQQKLDYLRDYMGDCRRCGLCAGRKQIVFGRGNPDARLVFVGGFPDAADDQTGTPFSSELIAGSADGLLTRMLAAMGLTPDDVYLSMLVKCRPPSGRAPLADEVRECAPFLFKQLSVIQPQVVVTLGEFATAALLPEQAQQKPGPANFARHLRGQWHAWRGIAVLPTHQPVDILQASGAAQHQLKRDTWHDLQMVMKKLDLKPS